jgi:hypothetical protein
MLTYPFPHVLAAAMVIAVGRWLSRRAPVTGAAIVLMGALAAAQNCKIANDQLVALAATGGTNNFSDAIYDVARTLEMEDPTAPVVALDWGLHLPLVGLSQGTLRSVELLAPSPEQLQSYFADQRARFVAHAPGATNVQAGRSTFLAAVAAAGRQAVREHEFRTRDGQPVIEVYALAPATTEAAAPATSVASLTASPEQLVLSPGELGSTWLNWHVKDSVGAEVWVSAKGEPEHLFARAVKGAQEAPWISAPGTYTFRLYAGEDRSTLLGTVRVTAERRT